MRASVTVVEFTDPGCPFAWSAEPLRRKLAWRYGDQVRWEPPRMVGLAATRDEYADKGLTPELVASSSRSLREEHGMPMDDGLRDVVAATLPACRAVVAATVHAPSQARPLLRALRLRHFALANLDDDATIAGAAGDVGLDASQLQAWMGGDEVEQALQADLHDARHPTPAALAQDARLAGWDGGRRYTCPSLELSTEDGRAMSAPGFQPLQAYELAFGNLVPEAEQHAAPTDPLEVLRWAAPEPLATAEVAAVLDVPADEARAALREAGAVEHPLGQDAVWTVAD